MNFDIEVLLEKTLENNPIYPFYAKIQRRNQINSLVKTMISDMYRKSSVVATTAYDINEIIIKNGFSSIDYCVLENVDSINIEQNTKSVLIISYDDHAEWKEKLFAYFNGEVEIIDLYEELERAGFSLSKEYYEIFDSIRDPYADINRIRRRIKECNSGVEDLYYELIYLCIEIRDFRNALFYIEEYLDTYTNDAVSGLYDGLRELFEAIGHEIKTLSGESIIMCWVDAIQYDVLDEMPYLHREKDSTLCFENSYTVSPFTIPTYYTIFCKKRCIEDNLPLYKHDTITVKNSPLLEYLDKNGYLFLRHGDSLNIFENENCSYGVQKNDAAELVTQYEMVKNVKFYKEFDSKEDICPILLWSSLRDVLLFEKVFTLPHIVMETHTPYISPKYDGNYVNSEFAPNVDQVNSARSYVDEQLKFYCDIWKGHVKEILMSDHGKVEYGNTGRKYTDIHHTFLMCHGKELPVRRCPEMFSYMNFIELVRYVVEPKRNCLSSLFSESVQLEDLDKYGIGAISSLKGKQTNIEKSGLLGYQAVRTQEGMLVERNDGKESFFKYPSLIDYAGLAHDDVIEKMRLLVSPHKQCLDGPFYSVSRIIRDSIREHDQRVAHIQKEAQILLEELLEMHSGKTIALRGEVSSVYPIVTEFMDRYLIKYVVDNGFSEAEETKGILFCDESRLREENVDLVIISSHKYRTSMVKSLSELEFTGKRPEIIDMFSFFEKKGVNLTENYHADTISTDDLSKVAEEILS